MILGALFFLVGFSLISMICSVMHVPHKALYIFEFKSTYVHIYPYIYICVFMYIYGESVKRERLVQSNVYYINFAYKHNNNYIDLV